MPKTAQLLEDSLLVIWNDRGATNRLEAMKKTYAPDIHFFEANMGDPFVGHQAMNALIDKLQPDRQAANRVACRFPVCIGPAFGN